MIITGTVLFFIVLFICFVLMVLALKVFIWLIGLLLKALFWVLVFLGCALIFFYGLKFLGFLLLT